MPASSQRLSERHRAEARRLLREQGITTDELAAPYLGRIAPQASSEAVPLAEFVASCLIVEKETGVLIPFALWDAQREALAAIEAHEKLIVPKGRQVGVTWLELAAMLHAGSAHGHRLFLIARQSLEYAQDAITRLCILAGYDPNTSPPEMRVLAESPMSEDVRPKVIAKTTTSLTLANGSHFRALTATQQIGRGLAAYWGLADELAFWPWPAQQVAALESGCSRLHIVSTGNGEGDYFHHLWENAEASRGDYHPLFIPSTADPRRDADWYRRNVDEAADADLARREHARTAADAFRAPEGAYFKRFSRETHVASFDVVPSLRTFRGVDFGYRHPACVWWQEAPTGQPQVIGELLPESVTTTEFALAVLAMDAELGVAPEWTFCDPAGRAANVQTAESEFEVFQRHGLQPWGRPSAVRDGCVRLMELLADPQTPLVVHERCIGLIRALSQVKPHRTRPEVYDVDHELFSHPLDALRYLALNRATSADGYTAPTLPAEGTSNGGITAGLLGRAW